MFRLLRGRPGGGDQARGHAAGSRAAPAAAAAAAGSGVAAASAVAGVGGAGLAHVAGVACVVDVAIGVSYIHARHGVEVPVAAAAAGGGGVGYEHGLAGPRRRVRIRLGEEHGGEGQTHALLTRGPAAPFGRNLRAVRGLQVGALLYQHAVRHHVGLYLVRSSTP